jgi:hypothetical protein
MIDDNYEILKEEYIPIQKNLRCMKAGYRCAAELIMAIRRVEE